MNDVRFPLGHSFDASKANRRASVGGVSGGKRPPTGASAKRERTGEPG